MGQRNNPHSKALSLHVAMSAVTLDRTPGTYGLELLLGVTQTQIRNKIGP